MVGRPMSFPSSVEISIFFESVLSLFGLFLESSETDVDDICILITQTIYAFNVILRRCSLKRFYLLVMVIYKQIQPVPHMPWRAILQPAGKAVVKAFGPVLDVLRRPFNQAFLQRGNECDASYSTHKPCTPTPPPVETGCFPQIRVDPEMTSPQQTRFFPWRLAMRESACFLAQWQPRARCIQIQP